MSATSPALGDEAAHIPLWARVHLAHAVVQHVAEAEGVVLLHLKGPALLPELARARPSTDVDVLVRPRDERRFTAALARLGWEPRSDAATGSAFAHAANWWHDDWGYVDVHVSWPGPTVGPDVVFEALAAPGAVLDIAHVPCPVPDRVGQLLTLVLHAARSPDKSDLGFWEGASSEDREAVLALADRLGAQVAVAAALGNLDDFVDDPTYALWRHYAHGGTRIEEWRARWQAAPSHRARLRVLGTAVGVNRDHLRMELGRPPTRHDLLVRQGRRVQRLVRDLVDVVRRRR